MVKEIVTLSLTSYQPNHILQHALAIFEYINGHKLYIMSNECSQSFVLNSRILNSTTKDKFLVNKSKGKRNAQPVNQFDALSKIDQQSKAMRIPKAKLQLGGIHNLDLQFFTDF